MNMIRSTKRGMALILALALLILPVSLAESFYAYVSTSSMTVYSDAGMTTRIGSLSKYAVVTVLSYSGDSAWISYNNKRGYASVGSMTRVDDVARVASVKSDTYVYKKASTSSAKKKVKAGTDVSLVETNGDWSFVVRSGVGAFIKTSQLTVGDAMTMQPVVVNETKITVYQSAGTSSTVLGTLKKGTQVNLVSTTGDWAYIERNGQYGYCKRAYLSDVSTVTAEPTATPAPTTSTPATVTATTVQVYADASAASTKLGTLKKGASVNLISTNGQWAYVEKNGRYGYMLAAALGQSTSTAPADAVVTAAPAATTQMQVSDSSMKVYQSASTSSKKLGTLKKGTVVDVVSISGKWAYITRNGQYGYCKLSSLKTYDPLAGYTVETFSATVVRNGVEFYKSASTDAQHTSIAIGTDVTVTAFASNWAYVDYNGAKGYIPTADLSRQQFAALSSGSTGSTVSTLEKALLLMGYFDGAPDTTFDAETTSAVKRFQEVIGQTANGTANQSLQRVLFSGNAPVSSLLTSTLTKGSSGSDVTRLQKRLGALKYLSKTSSADGAYGTITVNAVAMFQAANGLNTTGVADSATIRKMYSATAVSLPSGKKAADADSVKEVSTGTQVNNSTSISATLASTTTSYSSGMSNSQRIEYVIYVAQNQLGKPYVFGATGTSSFDCSGLTMYSYKQAGVTLLRTAYEQGYNNNYTKISDISNLKRGDLVFFNTVSDNDLCDHTGIYLGAGWFIQASSGQHKVVVSTLTSGYYNRTFSWGRRILG